MGGLTVPDSYPVRRYRPRAEAYFLKGFAFGRFLASRTGKSGDNPEGWRDYFRGLVTKNAQGGEEVQYVSVDDVISVQTTLTVRNTPSTFSLRINNKGDKWFVKDDPKNEVPQLYAADDPESEQNKNNPNKDYMQEGLRYPYEAYENWASDYNYVLEETLPQGSVRFMVYVGNDDGMFYYFDSVGQRQSLENLDPSNPTSYTIKFGDTFLKIALAQLYHPEWWRLIATFADNTEFFESHKVPLDKNFDLSDLVGSNIALPRFDDAGSPRRKIYCFTNDMLYKGLGGSLESRGRCVFSPMDRVVIFLSGRFGPTGRPMLRAFTGLVNRVQDTTNAEDQSLDITGADVTKWLSLTQYAVNPALFNIDDIQGAQDRRIDIFTSSFAGLSGAEIIRKIILGDPTVNLWLSVETGMAPLPSGQLAKLSGAGPFVSTGRMTPESTYEFRYVPAGPGAEQNQFVKDELRKEYRLFVQDPFGKQYDHEKLTALQELSPYKKYWRNAFQLWQSEYTDRREICFQTAQKTNFLFYADGNGDIHYRQPRYDLANIYAAPHPEVYILDDQSLISFTPSESDEKIVTRMWVTGEIDYMNLDPIQQILIGAYGVYQDRNLANFFGQRLETVHEPMIRGNINEGDKSDYYFYAKSLIHRLAQNRFQATAQLTGRAELTPGYPVFVPHRNRIYFVEEVTHNYQQGGEFTTTCQLSYGRKPWEKLDELLTYRASGILEEGAIISEYEKLNLMEPIFSHKNPPDPQKPETCREIDLWKFRDEIKEAVQEATSQKWYDITDGMPGVSVFMGFEDAPVFTSPGEPPVISKARPITIRSLCSGTLVLVSRTQDVYTIIVDVGLVKKPAEVYTGVWPQQTQLGVVSAGAHIEVCYVLSDADWGFVHHANFGYPHVDPPQNLWGNSTVSVRPCLCRELQGFRTYPEVIITIEGTDAEGNSAIWNPTVDEIMTWVAFSAEEESKKLQRDLENRGGPYGLPRGF
jgi:hypothetical protein